MYKSSDNKILGLKMYQITRVNQQVRVTILNLAKVRANYSVVGQYCHFVLAQFCFHFLYFLVMKLVLLCLTELSDTSGLLQAYGIYLYSILCSTPAFSSAVLDQFRLDVVTTLSFVNIQSQHMQLTLNRASRTRNQHFLQNK